MSQFRDFGFGGTFSALYLNTTSISFLLSTLLSPEPSFLSVSSVTSALSEDISPNSKFKLQNKHQLIPFSPFVVAKNVREQLRKALRKPNSFNRPSKTNPQTVTWLEKKLTAYTKSSKKRLLQKRFGRTRHNRTLHFAYAMTNLKIYSKWTDRKRQ